MLTDGCGGNLPGWCNSSEVIFSQRTVLTGIEEYVDDVEEALRLLSGEGCSAGHR